MSQHAIFWPMIAHVALVYAVYVLIGLRRKKAVQTGSARVSQFRENREEPPESLFVRNNLANQFELPVLFHSVCLALFAVEGAGTVAIWLAWAFVLSRYAHAYVHVTSNRIRYRQPLFVLGFLALAAMWVLLALKLWNAG
ncbi:MAPEG family protein [Nitratireductor sp. B36]|uniref:MAPEG family protein n=1 Tax=Nitratireductor sp. B36 TaxID=2762059 RepID=UPI001E50E240|nr:MAPEG family protein [Nitratireductor sp. B36]MCC5778416.1 MAPEG family protein [Nitratireductor sp. B36]